MELQVKETGDKQKSPGIILKHKVILKSWQVSVYVFWHLSVKSRSLLRNKQ